MPGDDPIDDTTPIFTQAEVYRIGGFVAARFDPSLAENLEDPRIVEAIDDAVRWVLNR
jgi:hypothetical protein